MTKNAVQLAHTSLKHAISEWKASRRSKHVREEEKTMEEVWTRLSDEVEDATSVIRGADTQGLDAKEVALTSAQAKEILKRRPVK